MKSKTRSTLICLFFFSTLLLCINPSTAIAQGGLRAVLSQPDLDQFPNMTTYVDVYDSSNNFVSNLDAEQFTLEEDGRDRTINEVSRIEPGLHTIVALNLGPTLSNRLATDTTRFEDLVFLLTSWLNGTQSQAANLYSFTSNERAELQRSADPQEFAQLLQTYQPNLFNFEPDLSALSYAIDIAAQQPQMEHNAKQVIFYITPLPLDSDLDQLPILSARAADIGIPVYVWLIANETSTNSPAAEALRNLADATGGQFLLYHEKIEAPTPETYLSPLRYTYRLRYTSAINQSGFHRIKVQVERGVQMAETQDVSFQIELLPPEVTIIALPPQIQRVWVDAEEGGKVMKPDFITLQISVTFPDGYPRQLEYSRLLVDGEEIIRIDQQPFEWLGWPLDGYRMTATHAVLIEVEDILGFRNTSSLREVQIIAEPRYTGFWGGLINFMQSGGWIILIVVSIFGVLAGYASYRRRNPRPALAGMEPAINFSEDPLTQQVIIPVESAALSSTSRITTRQLVPYLFPLEEQTNNLQFNNGMNVDQSELIIGSDPQQADLVIDHPSISPVHARLRRAPQGTIILADMDSEIGTRVNYAPVSRKGTVLRNNDLVHIGEVAYSFKLITQQTKKEDLQ